MKQALFTVPLFANLLLIAGFACTSPGNSTSEAEQQVDATAALLDHTAREVQEVPAENGFARLNPRLREEGVDFYARGNEPSWALNIDLDRKIQFMNMGGLNLTTPAVEGVRAMDANVLRYAAETEAGSLDITIMEKTCTDNMSGEVFTHQVRVRAKSSADSDFTEFEGCGRYTIDLRLNDIWALESLNGEALDPTSFPEGLPRLEFHINDGKLIGFGGCNELSGTFKVMEVDAIRFGPIRSTRMTCPVSATENAMLQALAERQLQFELSEGSLRLSSRSGNELIFKKID